MIQEIKEKAYRRGWNERKEFDSGLIEEALRKSQDYEEFSLILRERIAKEELRGEILCRKEDNILHHIPESLYVKNN